jgi:hypothetical protein
VSWRVALKHLMQMMPNEWFGEAGDMQVLFWFLIEVVNFVFTMCFILFTIIHYLLLIVKVSEEIEKISLMLTGTTLTQMDFKTFHVLRRLNEPRQPRNMTLNLMSHQPPRKMASRAKRDFWPTKSYKTKIG